MVIKKVSAYFLMLTASFLASGALAAQHPLVFRLPGEPETLDWNRAHTAIETHLLDNLMEGLVGFDSNLKPVPQLAESWKISKDGKTYTFKLKPGVKWSDGVPLKAQDFVTSWKRLLSPVTAAAYAYFLYDVEGAEAFNQGKSNDFSTVGVHALDDRTLEVKLAHPVSHWIYIPSFWVTYPLREDVIAKYGNTWATPGKMVTLGAFTLASHDIDSKIVLRPNPNYHGTRGNVDEVSALIVRDDATAVSLFEAGKIDFTSDLPPMDTPRLRKNPGFRSFPYLKTSYLGLVVDKYPLNQVRFRQALLHAIDRSKVCEALSGSQTPAGSWVAPPMLGSDSHLGLKFDPGQAKADLVAAGVDPATPPKLELILPNWEKSITIAQVVQGQLKKNLNLQLDLQPFDNKTYRAQMDLRTYPIFLATWSADYPDPDNFASVFLGSSGNNRTGWKSAKYDELVLKARSTAGAEARKKLYAEAQKMLQVDQAVILPLCYEPNLALVSPRAQGLELDPLNNVYFRKVNIRP